MKSTFNLKGLADFERKIKRLPEHVKDKAASRATAKAADLLKSEVKKNVPLAQKSSYVASFRGAKIQRRRGDLAKALILKRIPSGERGDFASVHKVVFLRNAETQGIGYIANFLENGTKPHEIKQRKRVLQHKGTSGSRFFAKTLRRNRKKMNALMEAEIMQAMENYFK